MKALDVRPCSFSEWMRSSRGAGITSWRSAVPPLARQRASDGTGSQDVGVWVRRLPVGAAGGSRPSSANHPGGAPPPSRKRPKEGEHERAHEPVTLRIGSVARSPSVKSIAGPDGRVRCHGSASPRPVHRRSSRTPTYRQMAIPTRCCPAATSARIRGCAELPKPDTFGPVDVAEAGSPAAIFSSTSRRCVAPPPVLDVVSSSGRALAGPVDDNRCSTSLYRDAGSKYKRRQGAAFSYLPVGPAARDHLGSRRRCSMHLRTRAHHSGGGPTSRSTRLATMTLTRMAKPRADGTRSLLTAPGISCPEGSPD